MLNVITKLEKSEGFDWVYGAKSLAPTIPGTAQADAVALYEQLLGKAFLEAFNTLKGGGQITEKEGEKATAAITRASNRKQSPEAAKEALIELRGIITTAVKRAQSKAGQEGGVAPRRVRVDAEGNVIGN